MSKTANDQVKVALERLILAVTKQAEARSAEARGGVCVMLPMRPIAFDEVMAQLERSVIEQALFMTGGVISKAAQWLSMPLSTLKYKIAVYHLKDHAAA